MVWLDASCAGFGVSFVWAGVSFGFAGAETVICPATWEQLVVEKAITSAMKSFSNFVIIKKPPLAQSRGPVYLMLFLVLSSIKRGECGYYGNNPSAREN